MTASLTVFPMHGQRKLLREGYRTRDGHLIEWFGSLLMGEGQVEVRSRPEPMALRWQGKARRAIAPNTVALDSFTLRFPSPLASRQRWWVDSSRHYRAIAGARERLLVTWNPTIALSNIWPSVRQGRLHVDLLDDWTNHYAFASIRKELVRAYGVLFESAHSITANSEATLELARRYGRSDAQLLLNGCDPERFSQQSRASGPLTVGYVGKIGRRLDLEGILRTVRSCPSMRFVFAGPVLDREYRAPLRAEPNVRLLGDVHYDSVPALLQTFDIGWVPHGLNEKEVGGDVLKTYEYCAAGLPVLSTPVLGAGKRGIGQVEVLPISSHSSWLHAQPLVNGRVCRSINVIPHEVTWRSKAETVLRILKGNSR